MIAGFLCQQHSKYVLSFYTLDCLYTKSYHINYFPFHLKWAKIRTLKLSIYFQRLNKPLFNLENRKKSINNCSIWFVCFATQEVTEVSAHLLLWTPALCVEMGFMRTFLGKQNGTEDVQVNFCQKLLFLHQYRTYSALVVFMVIPWTIYCHFVGQLMRE